MQFSKVE